MVPGHYVVLFCSVATKLKFHGQTLAKILHIRRRFHKNPHNGSRFFPYEQTDITAKGWLFFRNLAKAFLYVHGSVHHNNILIYIQ